VSHGLRHPFTRALYERDGDGIIVREGERWGRFTARGQWIDGDVREADPHLCGWVAGRPIANHRIADSSGDSTAREAAKGSA
jgi:hypothetical protein